MLIKNKKSDKTRREDNLNREHSTAGRVRAGEAESLQESVQGGLSDLARQSPNGVIDDEQAANYFNGLTEESEMATPTQTTTLNPKIVKRHVLRGGKLVQINNG